MTARELAVAHQKPGECAWCDERYQKIEDAVARELAERIRNARVPVGFEDGADFAADLIDPEKERPC